MPIVVRLNGAEKVITQLTELSRRGGPLTTADVLSGVGELAIRSVQRGMREQKSPDGTPYKVTSRFGEPAQRLMDTNRLLRSLTKEVAATSVTIGTNVDYAQMQHFGGVQRPSTAKALAIPLTRQVARAVAAAGNYRAAFPDAFIFKSNSQGVFLVRKRPDATPRMKRQLEFLAILKKSVKIAPTHFLGLSAEGEADILNFIQRRIQRIVPEAK